MTELERKKKCCDNPFIIRNDNGALVCKNCGMVFSDIIFNYDESPHYTPEDFLKNSFHSKVINNSGSRTIIFTKNSNFKKIKYKERYSKLSKIQNRYVNSKENNLSKATLLFKSFFAILNTPKYLRKDIINLYKKIIDAKLTVGRAILDFILVAIYLSYRIYKIPLIQEELTNKLGIPNKKFDKYYRLTILKLKLKIPPLPPESFVQKFCNNLHLPPLYVIKINEFIQFIRETTNFITGKKPHAIAISSIYIFCKMDNIKLSQKRLSEISYVSCLTLQKQYRKLEVFLPLFNKQSLAKSEGQFQKLKIMV